MLSPGTSVTVKPLEAIRETLDADGRLHGLPFTQEMEQFCGRTFRVFRRADKTCAESAGMREMKQTVFLDGVYCDGSSHDGCQRLCLLFWKEQWLSLASRDKAPRAPRPQMPPEVPAARPANKDGKRRYRCQLTDLPDASRPLPSFAIRQYVRDWRSGQHTLREQLRFLRVSLTNKFRAAAGLSTCGFVAGTHADTPTESLSLRPGERVVVKSLAEIARTLDATGANRGLPFTPEMTLFCGGVHEVLGRVERMVVETGEMRPLKNTVVLKNVTCDGSFHRGCPRHVLFLWREIWLCRESASPAEQS